jgi:hypothetical protein
MSKKTFTTTTSEKHNTPDPEDRPGEPIPEASPDIDRLFPTLNGTFSQRWATWQRSAGPAESLRQRYLHAAIPFTPSDQLAKFFFDLVYYVHWQTVCELLTFEEAEKFGGLGDLDLLGTYLDAIIPDCEEPVSVSLLKCSNYKYIPWNQLERMPQDWSVPVLDFRKSIEHVLHPDLNPNPELSQFGSAPDWILRMSKGGSGAGMEYTWIVLRAFLQAISRDPSILKGCAIVLRPVLHNLSNDEFSRRMNPARPRIEVLQSLVQNVWQVMNDTYWLHRLAPIIIPEQPTRAEIETEGVAVIADRIGRLMQLVNAHHPNVLLAERRKVDATLPDCVRPERSSAVATLASDVDTTPTPSWPARPHLVETASPVVANVSATAVNSVVPTSEDKADGEQTAAITDRELLILETMLEMDAVGPTKGARRDDIAKRVNRNFTGDQCKRNFSRLKQLGYTDSKAGPEGCVWLTLAGAAKTKAIAQSGQ